MTVSPLKFSAITVSFVLLAIWVISICRSHGRVNRKISHKYESVSIYSRVYIYSWYTEQGLYGPREDMKQLTRKESFNWWPNSWWCVLLSAWWAQKSLYRQHNWRIELTQCEIPTYRIAQIFEGKILANLVGQNKAAKSWVGVVWTGICRNHQSSKVLPTKITFFSGNWEIR